MLKGDGKSTNVDHVVKSIALPETVFKQVNIGQTSI